MQKMRLRILLLPVHCLSAVILINCDNRLQLWAVHVFLVLVFDNFCTFFSALVEHAKANGELQ